MLRRGDRVVVFVAILTLLGIVWYQSRGRQSNSLPDFNVDTDIDDSPKKPLPNVEHLQLNSQHEQPVVRQDLFEEVSDGPSYLLPEDIVNGVKSFMFFVGYARSGHSVVASMLDAHPHIVIAHEYGLFVKWQEQPSLHSNKNWLFSTLYANSLYHNKHGLRTMDSKKKGYSLAIPRSWQGSYDTSISIIGDKSGGITAQVFRKNHDNFKQLFYQLKTALQIPVRVLYVVRNPYDNIATMLLYNVHQKYEVNATQKYVDFEGLENQISAYFNQVKSVMDMIRTVPLENVIQVHNSDMIANPKETLRKLCSQLHIYCSPEYVHMCTESTFMSESRSRHLVEWTPELINVVAQKIQKYEHLKRYSI